MWQGFVGPGARGAFAIGLAVGMAAAAAAFWWLKPEASPSLVSGGAAMDDAAPTLQWHHGAVAGGLEPAVRISARLLPGAGAPAAAIVPVASAPAGDGVAGLLARAEDHRRKREFEQACDLYAAVASHGAMTADAWADYADAQASLTGRISGEPARSIAAALALEPRHAKALWLQASLAHEEHRYSDALATWQRLLAVVPPDSSDARIVEANIAEARRLAAG
jgi:hypothetical protein